MGNGMNEGVGNERGRDPTSEPRPLPPFDRVARQQSPTTIDCTGHDFTIKEPERQDDMARVPMQ